MTTREAGDIAALPSYVCKLFRPSLHGPATRCGATEFGIDSTFVDDNMKGLGIKVWAVMLDGSKREKVIPDRELRAAVELSLAWRYRLVSPRLWPTLFAKRKTDALPKLMTAAIAEVFSCGNMSR